MLLITEFCVASGCGHVPPTNSGNTKTHGLRKTGSEGGGGNRRKLFQLQTITKQNIVELDILTVCSSRQSNKKLPHRSLCVCVCVCLVLEFPVELSYDSTNKID